MAGRDLRDDRSQEQSQEECPRPARPRSSYTPSAASTGCTSRIKDQRACSPYSRTNTHALAACGKVSNRQIEHLEYGIRQLRESRVIFGGQTALLHLADGIQVSWILEVQGTLSQASKSITTCLSR